MVRIQQLGSLNQLTFDRKILLENCHIQVHGSATSASQEHAYTFVLSEKTEELAADCYVLNPEWLRLSHSQSRDSSYAARYF